MRKTMFFVVFSAFVVLLGCGSKGPLGQDSTKATADAVSKDVQSQLWNCDYSLFEKAKKITVYRLNPVIKVDSSDIAIANFKVIDKGTKLNQKQQDVLKFLVTSPLSYNNKTEQYKKIFAPYFAYEFQNGKDVLFLLVDISSDEWAVANKGEILQQGFTASRKYLIQLGHDIFPNDKYIDAIIKNIKENEK